MDKVPWMPTTPIKPVAVKPVPICPPGESYRMGHANEAVACVDLNKFSLGQEKICGSRDGSNTANDSGKTFEQIASDAVSSYSKLGFCEHLFAVEAESRNSSVAKQGVNDILKNPFVPSFILDNARDPQEKYVGRCDERTFQDTPLTIDNTNKEESRQMASMQINMEEGDPGGKESNIPANILDNDVPPNSKELCNPVVEFSSVSSPLKENHNPDKGSSHDTDLSKTPQQKTRRRKHRPKVIKEDKPKRTRKPVTPKPVESKENPTVKRKYVRRKGLNQNPTSPTAVTGELINEMSGSAKMSCKRSLNFDAETRDESSSAIENTTALFGKENGVLIQETCIGLTLDLNTSMKQAQTPNTSSRRKDSGRTEEKPDKRKYVKKKKVTKASTPSTEVIGELTTEKMPDSTTQMSCIGSANCDEKAAIKDNPTVHLGNEFSAVEMNVHLAYDLNTSMKQASNSSTSLPEDTLASNTSSRRKEENPAARPKKGTRKRVIKTSPTEVAGALTKEKMLKSTQMSCTGSINFDQRARDQSYAVQENPIVYPGSDIGAIMQEMNVLNTSMNSYPIPPTELTEAMMLESNNMSWRRSLNFDTRTRDGKYIGRENSDLHIGKEHMVLEETKVGFAYNQDTWMKGALNNCMSLHAETQPLSTPLKPSANSVQKKKKRSQATAQDGNINNGQSSTISFQMAGSKRKQSGTFDCADDGYLNLIGAHYNGLPSYQTNFSAQLPNMQKKRRTEEGTTSDCYVASYPREDALAHPYASSSRCWIYGSGYMHPTPARNELAENFIDNSQTFDEFLSSLKRLTERSQSSTCEHGSLTGIRNFDTDPNYTAKQGVSGNKAFGDAERPQTSIDVLVAEKRAPLTKKKRSRKKGVLSRSDITHDAIWKTVRNADALTEVFRRLNINTEASDLAFSEQNALVPYEQQSSLVPGDGAIIPVPIKKQPRPKVELDDETDRVWKLLMLDINSHGIDGTNEDKAKWWEEERKVFRGRADSFIARMHLVQGDRRFSRWKGSVVDSVVGVFLTQNVSDHLSSSAFMYLAARFPKKSSSMCKTHLEEDTRLVANEPQVHVVEPEESAEWDVKLLNQSVYNQSSLTIDIAVHSGEKEAINKEAINSNDSCGVTSSVISLTDESNSRLSELSQRNIKEHCSPMRSGVLSVTTEEGEEKSCYNGDGKDLNDIVSSQGSVISSQISGDFSNDQTPEKIGSYSDSNSEVEDLSSTVKYNHFDSSTSFSKLLEMVSSTRFYEDNIQKSKSIGNLGELKVNCFDPSKTEASSREKKDENGMNIYSFQTTEPAGQVPITHSQSIVSQVHPQEQSNHLQQSVFNVSGQSQDLMQKDKIAMRNETNEISSSPKKLKSTEQGKEKKGKFNWDSLRIEAQARAGKREKTENTMDSLDWDAVRCADVNVIADTIKERGMNNRLAERIQDFLNRLVKEHGGIDLEWLRDVPPDKAKEYLLSVRGLGLKSVECVRLLTLHHLAFPVDTNVGRIAVRLGWVPLQPLPESLQLHLLELYPVLESIQKYLWPRLCKLDQKTLYELHYQMITFGKVFCTKSKPNCNACPMRGECRHFASAFASARLALPGPEQKSIVVSTAGNSMIDQKIQNPSEIISQLHLPPPENTTQAEVQLTEVSRQMESKFEINICQPIIEEPTTPEPECLQVSEADIEDALCEDSCEIPTIKLNIEEFALNLQNYMQEKMELQEGEMSKALVALNPAAASIPMPKLKNVSRLRTEHCVYELPDTHPLLQGWDTREPDDPGKYLLAIWTPGETANSIQPPESKCSSREECGQLCSEKECFSCNSFREANSQIVRGTILIPCRTAMRGSFPLNGTYFQVNEVFADHDSSIDPVSVPRSWIWHLNRRTVYFGTSVTSIFKGLTTQEIQQCFWRGFVCVRGFDRETRAPRPLKARLHFPASKLSKANEKKKKGPSSAKSLAKSLAKSSAKSRGLKKKTKQPELISNGNNLQQT